MHFPMFTGQVNVHVISFIFSNHLKSLTKSLSMNIPQCSIIKAFHCIIKETSNQSRTYQLNSSQHQINHRHKPTHSIIYAYHALNQSKQSTRYIPLPLCVPSQSRILKTFSQSGTIKLITRSFTSIHCRCRPAFLNTHQHSLPSVVHNLFTKELKFD